MALKDWLNDYYLDTKNIVKLKKQFSSAKPFSYLQLPDFLKAEHAILLLKSLSQEQFTEKESDLFKLHQTQDFVSTENSTLKEFREFLASKEFIDFMKQLTGMTLKSKVIDINGSMYQFTDFLLPHDDQLEGRKIAFIYYLSTLTESDGGALALFDSKSKKPTKVAKELYPESNCFKFFKVSDVSFHQVNEIVSQKQRISINGWFHG